jgi:serine/threonine protein phosphatase PrpC
MADQLLKTLDAAELTNVGLVRERNEDASKILIPPPELEQAALGALFMVVDGMGGLGGGDVASRYAVAEIARHYYTDESEVTDPATRLQAALQSANDVVGEQAPRIGRPRIGATAAGIVISPSGDLVVFNVGDCRVYRVRQGQIERISHDQSVMEREIEAGISPERAAQMTRSSLVTAFLGQPVPLQPNLLQDRALRGDVYVICCDGVWSLVEANEFLSSVKGHSPRAAAKKLIGLVLKRGAPDNATVIVVRVGKPSRMAAFARRLVAALIFAVILTAGGIGLNVLNGRSSRIAAASPTLVATSTRQAVTVTAALIAAAINSLTPTATASPVPTSTPTHTPPITPRPSDTPAPTDLPTLTAAPTDTLAPTNTEVAALLAATTPVQANTAAVTDKPTVTLNPFVLTYTPTPRRTRTPIPSATPVPRPTVALIAYRITGTAPVEARACANVTCRVVLTFQPGQTISTVGIVPGSAIKGREGTKWLKIPSGTSFVYVHSSFAEPASATTPESIVL